ncbi:hypothetical protein HYQ46_012550 [Verticillium longisporum]|nr:hypothetical protein HYQ46_012550 [Verticillium longisporum]
MKCEAFVVSVSLKPYCAGLAPVFYEHRLAAQAYQCRVWPEYVVPDLTRGRRTRNVDRQSIEGLILRGSGLTAFEKCLCLGNI